MNMLELDKLIIWQRCPVCRKMANKWTMIPVSIYWSAKSGSIVALACKRCAGEPVYSKAELMMESLGPFGATLYATNTAYGVADAVDSALIATIQGNSTGQPITDAFKAKFNALGTELLESKDQELFMRGVLAHELAEL